MKKSYKGFMAWLVLFCVGVLAIIYMDIKNIDLVGLVLGNYMFITLAILTGMIYKKEAINNLRNLEENPYPYSEME